MTAPIGKIGGQRAITREAGSAGHEQVARKLDGDPRAAAAAPRVNEKVMNVAKMYERQFLGEMFKAMRSTVSETDKPSMAQNIYNSQRDEQYIDAWSEQGGVGFSKVIYDPIMERFFGQTQSGRALKQQGMIPLTNRDIANVSQVKAGIATPVVPLASTRAPVEAAANEKASNVNANMNANATVETSAPALKTTAQLGETRTVENTEPMPAPTPRPQADTRTTDERLAAGEHFPEAATAREPNEKAKNVNANMNVNAYEETLPPQQTALQIEVRPSPTGQPAKIQAPWDATVVQATRLDGRRTAVTMEHGKGLRSTLVFDGVLSSQATPGQKIPRGEAIATLNQDAKSFLWNLAPQTGPQSQTE